MEEKKEFVRTYLIERIARDNNRKDLSLVHAVTQDIDEIKNYVLDFAREAYQTKERYGTITSIINVTIYTSTGLSYFKFMVFDNSSSDPWINCAPIYGSKALDYEERTQFKKRLYFELKLNGEYEFLTGR